MKHKELLKHITDEQIEFMMKIFKTLKKHAGKDVKIKGLDLVVDGKPEISALDGCPITGCVPPCPNDNNPICNG